MTLGLAERQFDLLDENRRFCEEKVGPSSIYALLHRERDWLFPDEMFADLFADRGRRSVPPCVVATVMVLQKLEECSDREAVERFTFDLRWKYAAGVEGFTDGFVHTVLVNMRARLRDSADPNRIFRRSRQVAEDAGLIGMKRVLDSTPLYDAVATQDTVTLIRSAIRGLLRVADADCQARIRGCLRRDDDYRRAGKPSCDWDDAQAREAMIDELVHDGLAAISELEGLKLSDELAQAADLIATVIGQDVEQTEDGTFRIARRVAPDRVISTVDTQARPPQALTTCLPAWLFAASVGSASLAPRRTADLPATGTTPVEAGIGTALHQPVPRNGSRPTFLTQRSWMHCSLLTSRRTGLIAL